ncbi:MAG: histidine kinase [Flavobacterium sp.]|nr:histidine kinase [Flavobacterium sp.]
MALYTFSLSLANNLVFVQLDKIFVNNRFSPQRLIIGFVSCFLVSLFVIFLLRIFEVVFVDKKTFAYFIANQNPRDYVMAIVITFFVTLSLYAFHFYKVYNENIVKEQKVIAGTASAKYESLKSQIDPHFLFNSLNVLSSLIEENPENAQRFTTSLSKVYRYVLEQKDKNLVSVEEEVKFAQTYMNLLKMRFENSLTYEIPAENLNPEFKVVPLSLQLLLENTVKHNIVSEQRPLQIKIYIENGFLIIENNLQKKEVLHDRRGVGLQNIIDRYALISKKKMIIEQTENLFKVKLPILTKQITIMETQNIYQENNAYYNAKQKVEELKGFYGSLISYCVVIPLLVFINLSYSNGFQWFWFPAFGWGFGLVMQGLKVYGFSSKWEENKIREYMNK